MNITFANKNLEKLANDDRKRQKEFGKIRADKFKLRLGQLLDCKTLSLSSPSVSVGDPFGIVNFNSGFPPGTRGNDKVVWFFRQPLMQIANICG